MDEPAGDCDRAAFGHHGDAVFDRVFDERLNQERGDFAGVAGWIYVTGDAEAVAEARLLDIEIHVGQGHFFAERDGVALAEAKGGAEKIGKADAHFFVYKEIVKPASAAGRDTVKTNIRQLGNEERITAIAKMLSGEKPTAAAMENAREMVSN